MTKRFYVISEKYGLVSCMDEEKDAEWLAIKFSVISGRTVYIHDRMSELS